jgi:hypothetical protein
MNEIFKELLKGSNMEQKRGRGTANTFSAPGYTVGLLSKARGSRPP